MTEPPLVSIEEFERIECNRCGQCCEGFAYVGPIQVAESMGWYASLKREDWDFTDVDRTTAWWSHIAPVEGAEFWDDERGRRVTTYECDRFARDASGLGTCTAHERRPDVCRDFPYGRPVDGFAGCSWNVEILLN